MKRYIGLMIVTLMLFMLISCSNQLGYAEEVNQNYSAHALWEITYDSMDEIIKNADLIIVGECIGYKPLAVEDIILTDVEINIKSIYKGSLSKDDNIVIRQLGGKIEDRVYNPVEDAPLLLNENQYLLFLKEVEDGQYGFVGGYQGVANVTDKTVSVYEWNYALQEINNIITDEVINLVLELTIE